MIDTNLTNVCQVSIFRMCKKGVKMIYEIDYNLRTYGGNSTLEDCYKNSKQLREYKMPRRGLSKGEVLNIVASIPEEIRYQFLVTELDYGNQDVYGLPEMDSLDGNAFFMKES